MVSRILISIALLFSSVAMSQDENGLTFSQVMIVDITTEQVVPEGKVWKVVSVLFSGSTQYNNVREIYIDGIGTYIGNFSQAVPYALPLWLPEGTSILKSSDNIQKVNIIEFNTD